MTTTSQIYAEALKHHQSGELDRAEHLYHEVIRIDAKHADALHLLGVDAHQRNQNDKAVEYISQAINIKRTTPSFHSNLGAAFRALGKMQQAVDCLQTAVRLDPNYAEGFENLGVLLNEQGKYAEASESLQRARALKTPNNPAQASQPPKRTWSGIYRNFDEVPVRGTGHEGNRWAQATAEENRRHLQVMQTYNTIPLNTVGYHNFLPMLAGLVTQQTGSVRILDFGGATGTGFLHCVGAMADASRLEFHIVETESGCRLGEQLLRAESRITFHRQIADVPAGIDIVHINSALQYVSDYRAVLTELCACGAQYVLLPRLSAGDFPTYATAQLNLWDDVVAYWFINVVELIEIMQTGGYDLMFKGAEQLVYDQSNFPAEYRLHRACNLLFGLNNRERTPAAPQ